MRYDLTWGQYSGGLSKLPGKVKKKRTKRVPVRDFLIPYWDDFQSLHSRRQKSTEGPQPFSIEAVHLMYTTSAVSRNVDFRKYLKFLSALDDVYLEVYLEKRDK